MYWAEEEGILLVIGDLEGANQPDGRGASCCPDDSPVFLVADSFQSSAF